MAEAGEKTRSWALVIGVILIVGGLIIALGPLAGSFGRWAAFLLPLFLILAGVVRVASFTAYRKPRSPVGGLLLIVLGAIWLAGRVHSDVGLLSIYGKYWPGLLLLFGAIELLRYYSHKQPDLNAPSLFTPWRLIIILLIVTSGVIANRVAAKDPSLLSPKRIPGYIDEMRNAVAGRPFSFADAASVVADIRPGTRITINNGFGDIKLKVGRGDLRAILTKRLQGTSEEDARENANRVNLIVDRTPQGFAISTNRDQVDRDIGTDIEVEVPPFALVDVVSNFGNVKASGLRSPLSINAQHGQVGVEGIGGDISINGNYCDVEVANIDGNVTVTGAKRAVISRIKGGLDLAASNGSVEIREVAGPVRVDAPSCSVVAEGLLQPASLKTERASVKVTRAPAVSVTAPFSDVRAENITGNLAILSSHSAIRLRTVAGVRVNAEQSSVSAEEIRGPIEIETSHGEVTLKNFNDKVRLKTSYRDVKLTPGAEPIADIEVENDHGEIKLILPTTSEFNLDAISTNGRVRSLGFDSFSGTNRESVSFDLGVGGPRIRLRTSFKDIVIQGNANPSRSVAGRVESDR